MQINYVVLELGKQKDPRGNELILFRAHMQISEHLICSVNKDLERFIFFSSSLAARETGQID